MGGDNHNLGGFQRIEELPRGNTGRVFLAEDTRRAGSDDGLCVLKVLDRAHRENPRFVDVLRREAPAAKRFAHVYSARTLDVSTGPDQVFYVRELVDGMPASALLDALEVRQAHLPWEFVATLGVQLARLFGTAAAGAQDGRDPLLHGHLSCASVFVTWTGFLKVVGLGLGRARSALPVGARQLPFRAPELLLGEPMTAAADVYGIGAVLHALLTRRRVFEGGCVSETRQAILHEPPISVRSVRREVPAELDELLKAMMAKRPLERPRRLAGVEQTLRGLLREPDGFYADGLAQQMAIYFPNLARLSEDRREQARSRRRLRGPTPLAQPWPARPSRAPEDLELNRGRPNGPEARKRIRTPKPATGIEVAEAKVIEGPWSKRWADEVTPSLDAIDSADPFDVEALVDAIVDSRDDDIPADVEALVDAIVASRADRADRADRALAEPVAAARGAELAATLRADSSPADPLQDLVFEPPEEVVITPTTPFESITPAPVESTADLLMEGDRGLEAGALIGERYRVLELIGHGGASYVYRAEHTSLKKVVALKVLKPELSTLEEASQRFLIEARSMSQLEHRNIARVSDFGRTHNGSLFLVMELCPGECLADVLKRRARLPTELTLRIGLEVLDGLGHAHARGVVHRDLKPENVMVDLQHNRVSAKLLDFGIAKVVEAPENPRLTQPGRVFGTPRYMAPEQARGHAIDGRVDLYALGVCMYEMLEGRPAFPGDNAIEVLSAVLSHEPEPVLVAPSPSIRSERVAEVISRALSKNPEARFRNAEQMQEAIIGCFGGPRSVARS